MDRQTDGQKEIVRTRLRLQMDRQTDGHWTEDWSTTEGNRVRTRSHLQTDGQTD